MNLDFYRTPVTLSDPGRQAALFDDLPRGPDGLAGVVQGVLMHQFEGKKATDELVLAFWRQGQGRQRRRRPAADDLLRAGLRATRPGSRTTSSYSLEERRRRRGARQRPQMGKAPAGGGSGPEEELLPASGCAIATHAKREGQVRG